MSQWTNLTFVSIRSRPVECTDHDAVEDMGYGMLYHAEYRSRGGMGCRDTAFPNSRNAVKICLVFTNRRATRPFHPDRKKTSRPTFQSDIELLCSFAVHERVTECVRPGALSVAASASYCFGAGTPMGDEYLSLQGWRHNIGSGLGDSPGATSVLGSASVDSVKVQRRDERNANPCWCNGEAALVSDLGSAFRVSCRL